MSTSHSQVPAVLAAALPPPQQQGGRQAMSFSSSSSLNLPLSPFILDGASIILQQQQQQQQQQSRMRYTASWLHTRVNAHVVGSSTEALRMVTFMNPLRHPNLEQLVGVVMDKQRKLVITQYVQGYTLAQLFRTAVKGKPLLSMRTLLTISAHVARALVYLHVTSGKGHPNLCLHSVVFDRWQMKTVVLLTPCCESDCRSTLTTFIHSPTTSPSSSPSLPSSPLPLPSSPSPPSPLLSSPSPPSPLPSSPSPSPSPSSPSPSPSPPSPSPSPSPPSPSPSPPSPSPPSPSPSLPIHRSANTNSTVIPPAASGGINSKRYSQATDVAVLADWIARMFNPPDDGCDPLISPLIPQNLRRMLVDCMSPKISDRPKMRDLSDLLVKCLNSH